MSTFASPTAVPTKRPEQTDEEFVAQMHALGYRQITRWIPDTANPAFETEYRRQMAVLSEHYRKTNNADLLEPDEEDVKGWT
jgi:hypothetical protein